MTSRPQRIDVHHHFLPPDFVNELKRKGVQWTGGPPIPEWNLDLARAAMERHGIATAIASVVPQVHWGDGESAARWARHVNEFTARAIEQDPQRFGGFASLPLPDTGRALVELEHALDVLKLDGVMLMSSSGTQYLGDPAFEELFQELERREAVVFIHPNTVPPGATVPRLSIPWSLVEFVLDTTRAVTNLVYSGTLERYPSIRFIVSHAGGTVPFIAQRLTLGETKPALKEKAPQGALHYLKRLYYDTALSASEPALAALREFVPSSQVLFGSDFPMANDAVVATGTKGLEASRVLDDATRAAIDRDNALALFPRFARQPAGVR